MMGFHILTTDASIFETLDLLSQFGRPSAIIIPENRIATPKVKEVLDKAVAPVFVHRRDGGIESDCPPAEFGISWFYSQLFNTSDINRYSIGLLNMHGGKLPEYRGASVLQWAIVNGENTMGVTWHQIVEEVDAGPIWAESSIPIPLSATGGQMREAMIEEAFALLPKAIERMEQRQPYKVPNLSAGHVWPQRKRSDGEIFKGMTKRAVFDLVRAAKPNWPNPFIVVNSHQIEVANVYDTRSMGRIDYLTLDCGLIYLEPIDAQQGSRPGRFNG
jgi:methionyl-tRNA formyltransferase